MGAAISIEASSIRKNPSGQIRALTVAEVAIVATACAQLLEELGDLSGQVEVIKVVPWHNYGYPNIFDVKVVLSTFGEGATKVEVLYRFQHHVWLTGASPDWDLEELRKAIVSQMKQEIHRAIQMRMATLTQMRERWERLLPQDANV